MINQDVEIFENKLVSSLEELRVKKGLDICSLIIDRNIKRTHVSLNTMTLRRKIESRNKDKMQALKEFQVKLAIQVYHNKKV